MAASRSMLESLLARVRQRATEPRGQPAALPRQGAPVRDNAATSPPARVAAVAAPVAVPEEEIEEYDDELIEILDDDVASESSPPPPPSSPASAPLELRASAPSVEMRRRAMPPSSQPNQVSAPRAAVPAPTPAAAAVPGSAVAALRAEVVARRPVPAGAVVQAQPARAAQRSSFVDLLDASLDLGK